MSDQESGSFRLPCNIKPSHYDLTLKPNLNDFRFEGRVQIDYSRTSAERYSWVTLHAKDLIITQALVGTQITDETVTTTAVSYNDENETVTIDFDRAIPDRGCLTLEFKGNLNKTMFGFYRTSYEVDGVTVVAATSHFEPTYARRCFPCFDEPAIRATFSVTLVYDKYYKADNKLFPNVALSNMPIAELTGEDKMTAKFEKTVSMSTYLLAFIVGPFEYVEASDGKRMHRVYTTPGKKEQGRFALDVGCKALRFYEDYFKIEYPLKKLDQIAIPDFLIGAMENWGLITFRELRLLVEPGRSSTVQKQGVALCVAHEIAHQWFGNLVTIDWWTHLWLKEGFASFMEFLCVDHIFPEWDIWSQFAADTYEPAMDLDALDNSHPVEVPIRSPAEIDEVFDRISYDKGSSVLRMLHQYIGDESFRRGMNNYLTEHAYGSAITEDLWKSLEQASGKPVAKLMSGWTLQKGYPYLSVEYSREDGDSVKLSITQYKFTAHGRRSQEDAKMRWCIPLDALTAINPTKLDDKNTDVTEENVGDNWVKLNSVSSNTKTISLGLLDDKNNEVTVEGVGDNWIKLNSGTVSLYRTRYPVEMMEKLFQAISEQKIPAIDRYGILNDFLALCQAGHMSTVKLLNLLEWYRGETHYTVWVAIDKCFNRLSRLMQCRIYDDELARAYNTFGIYIFSEIFKKLTWNPQPNEKYSDPMLRALVINNLVNFREESVVEECRRRYQAHVDKTELIPADLMTPVFRAISRYGKDEDFVKLIEYRKSCTNREENVRLERAIGGSKNAARLGDIYSFLFSGTVREQDLVFVILAMANEHPTMGWRMLIDHLPDFKKMYGSARLMRTLVSGCLENLMGEDYYARVEKYFANNEIPGISQRTIQQAMERIKLNTKWFESDGRATKTFLIDALRESQCQ